MRIYPFIVGRGRAGLAIAESLAILKLQRRFSDFEFCEPIWVARDEALKPKPDGLSIAFIANPSALHASRIVEADHAGFAGIATEKPACTTPEQGRELLSVKTPTAVFHGYRQMWGPQAIRQMIDKNELGQIIAIEGKYWSSSAAERTINPSPSNSWKNSFELNGPTDTMVDIGTHWADLATFLAGEFPLRASGWSSYINAEQPHRDTHLHLTLDFSSGTRALGSISKTVHGAGNDLQIHVIGSKGSASWTIANPDMLSIGVGREQRTLTRQSTEYGSSHPAFHAMGWVEGYAEITKQLILEIVKQRAGQTTTPAGRKYAFPSLNESVQLVSLLLSAGICKVP